MNFNFITYIIGWVMSIESVTMLLPALVGLIYGENSGWYYLFFAILFLIPGIVIIKKKPENQQLFAKEGFVVVGLCWIIISIIGALPLCISGEIPSFTDALFEIVSGFTTTGASIVPNVEELTHAALFWRSFSHWIGGMGVFVFLLIIMPMAGGNNIHLLRAESPGPSVGKLVPKLKDTSKILYLIYFSLTVICFICLIIADMPLFDSILTALGTAGTGGFGIKCDSMGSYNDAIKWIVTVFMILFGVNFNFYFFLLGKNKKEAFKIEEIRVYFLTILISVIIIALNIRGMYASMYDCFRESAFQVGSLITSTGFATTDFNLWPSLSKGILISIMFMGACAGSTGGGIKVSRFIIMFKAISQEIYTYVHPKSVRNVSMDGKVIDKQMIKNVFMFMSTYFMIYLFSFLIICVDGFDLTTNFTSIVACMSNIGPGLEMVGPTGNFAAFSGISKYVLIFDMLAGRLELFPILILFAPRLWFKKK